MEAQNNDYSDIVTLEQALTIIADQDRIIGKLTREREYNLDTIYRFKECTRQRKKDAGYHDSISFDDVWEDILKKAKNNTN